METFQNTPCELLKNFVLVQRLLITQIAKIIFCPCQELKPLKSLEKK